MRDSTKRLTSSEELARKRPDTFRYSAQVGEIQKVTASGERLQFKPWQWPEKLGGDQISKESLRVLVYLHHAGEQPKSAIRREASLRSYEAIDRLVQQRLVRVTNSARGARYGLVSGVQAATKEQAEELTRRPTAMARGTPEATCRL